MCARAGTCDGEWRWYTAAKSAADSPHLLGCAHRSTATGTASGFHPLDMVVVCLFFLPLAWLFIGVSIFFGVEFRNAVWYLYIELGYAGVLQMKHVIVVL